GLGAHRGRPRGQDIEDDRRDRRDVESFLEVEGRRLGAHIATPRAAPGAVGPRPGLVLCHGLPAGPRGAVSCGSTFPELADHVAREASPGAAPDRTQWRRDAAALDARTAAARLAPRPLLVLHGSDDTVVDVAEARALAAAAGDAGELKVIASAGHELRHDPRAIALLIG